MANVKQKFPVNKITPAKLFELMFQTYEAITADMAVHEAIWDGLLQGMGFRYKEILADEAQQEQCDEDFKGDVKEFFLDVINTASINSIEKFAAKAKLFIEPYTVELTSEEAKNYYKLTKSAA